MTPLELIDRVYHIGCDVPTDPPPLTLSYDGHIMPRDVTWFAYYAAVASLAGDWLDEATTAGEAWEAIRHGESLHGAGILTDAEVFQRAKEIMLAAKRWGDRAHLNREIMSGDRCRATGGA
jgi:hypothetical protein